MTINLYMRSDVSRPDRLSSAEIASICQAAGLQGYFVASTVISQAHISSPAVRKNRYVILPVDFEEAWKVSVWLCIPKWSVR